MKLKPLNFKIKNKKVNKLLNNKHLIKTVYFLEHHHTLGITAIAFAISAVAVTIILAVNAPSQIVARTYFPNGCGVPTVPRNKTCTTSWTITRDQNNCRVFTCQP